MTDEVREALEQVRVACDVLDDEGSISSRRCTTFADALATIEAALTAERERAEVAEDALRLACRQLPHISWSAERWYKRLISKAREGRG